MRFSLMLTIRLIALGALVATLSAIGLSRVNPPGTALRTASPPRYYGLNGAMLSPGVEGEFLLDTQTGRARKADYGEGVLFRYVVSVPWRDARGKNLLMGRRSTLSGTGPGRLIEGAGLAIAGLDDGIACEMAETDPTISGFPCWLPGPPDRVVFPAADCRLYVQDLADPSNPGLDKAGGRHAPRPIGWRCETPGDGLVFMNDPARVPVASRGRYLVVSLATTHKQELKACLDSYRLWWLKLDPLDQSIVAAGALGRGSSREQRLPNFSVGDDGAIRMAYLERGERRTWGLRLATVAFDRPDGPPRVDPGACIEVADDVVTTLPAFSPDGRWLFPIARGFQGTGPVPRIDVGQALQASRPPSANTHRMASYQPR